MKLLIVSGRPPQRGGRGDQSRLHLLLEELSPRHDITVLTTQAPAGCEGAPAPVRTVCVPAGRVLRAMSAAGALLRGQPGQTGWMMPARAWRRAVRLAGEADVVLVVTTRSLRGPLPAPLVVDHVDALSFNMANRARGPESLLKRLAARFEAARMKAWERRVAGWTAAQIATSDTVAELLPDEPPPTVIPAAWEGPVLHAEGGEERDIDVIFTGDMSYPPNTDAARWLAEEILPLVRARRECSAWVVGRHADRLDLDGVVAAADVGDLHAYLRRAKVAVAPVRGRGSPFKTLEAAANGAALVATRWSVECYGLDARVAETSEEFAAGVVALLGDEELRIAQTRRARAAVLRHTSDLIASRFESTLERARGGDGFAERAHVAF